MSDIRSGQVWKWGNGILLLLVDADAPGNGSGAKTCQLFYVMQWKADATLTGRLVDCLRIGTLGSWELVSDVEA